MTRTLPQVDGLQRQDAQVILQLRVTQDLLWFDGHFPSHRILPGLAQLDWAARYGAEHFGLPVTCRQLRGVKFQKVIRPSQCVTLELHHDAAAAQLAFRYHHGEQVFSSGRLCYRHD